MNYDPAIHHRRSIRLPGYDYSRAGTYFITICTQNRLCLFGDIVGGKMRLNDAGREVETCWNDIPVHFPHVKLDEWQRNYWENIVRNETDLRRIREYIRNNPAQWESDRLNDCTG